MIIIIGGGGIGTKIAESLENCLLVGHEYLNVTKPDDIEYLFKWIEKEYGKIEVVINCAGIYGPIGKFHTNNLALWHKTINVNLLGTVNVCHAILKRMKTGKIINFSGGGALYPRPRFSAYATSKAAVVRFTETLAKEYPKVQINCIAPGFIRTKMTKNIQKSRKSQNTDKVIKAVNFLIKTKTTGKVVYAQDL